jgi:hypothetical protein
MPGSSHSQEAARLLEDTNLTFSCVELSGKSQMAAAFRDLGIMELPTLANDSQRYVGLDRIRGFVQNLGANSESADR